MRGELAAERAQAAERACAAPRVRAAALLALSILSMAHLSSCDREGVAKSRDRTIDDAREGGDPAVAAAVRPWFTDIAAEAGIQTIQLCGGPAKDHILESTGSACALFDFDRDGRLDVFLANAWALDEEPPRVRERGRSALYRNLGGCRFEEVTERAGIGDDSWGCGVAAADYDNDGFLDLYVTNFGANRLYRNRGDGTFEECAARAGVADAGWGAGAAFFDADLDGDLDLYVANYIECAFEEVLAAQRTNLWRGTAKVMAGPFGLRGGRDRYFRNAGDGTFRDATEEAGLTDVAEAYGLGVLASDLDNDGDMDLFVANDSNPNYLYRNDGTGRFAEIGLWSGAGMNVDGRTQANMGVDAADFDGDGLLDLFTTTFALDYSPLRRNTGGLLFEDVTARHDLRRATHAPLSWGCGFLDVDLDGDQDLIEINGHIYPQVEEHPELGERYAQPPHLFRNERGRLEDASAAAFPRDLAIPGRALALGDIDDDGDLDALVTAMDSRPLLFRNDAPRTGNWLKLRLLNRSGSPCVGARAVIAAGAGGARQVGEVRSGSTFQSQSTFDLHFGLGTAAAAERVEVRWPVGESTVLTAVAAGQTHEIREGE